MLLSFLICFAAMNARGQQSGVMGYWREPGGSVLHIEACGNDVCATLVSLSASAPTRVDANNPDASLRNRLLCGLKIGEGFRLTTPDKADEGRLYDPKSGKTYHGTLTSKGNDLGLRGYIGLSVFGRTEHWTRTDATPLCSH